MARTMSRGKGQILRDYLPGRTFDFQGTAPTIALVTHVRGTQVNGLNTSMLLQRIAEQARAWDEVNRPALRDSFLEDVSSFVFLDPTEVLATLYPRVLWCQTPYCGSVFVIGNDRRPPTGKCRACGTGDLQQLRFVRVHGCGEIRPLEPLPCQRCKRVDRMALVTRGSERVSEFRWVCKHDGTTTALLGGYCGCGWPANPREPKERTMDIKVHRAGSTFYAHPTVLLNAPRNALDAFLRLPESEWKVIAAAKFLGLPDVAGRPLASFSPVGTNAPVMDPGLSGAEIDELFRRQASGNLDNDGFMREMARMREQRRQESQAASPSGIATALNRQTGVDSSTWNKVGQELLEALLPGEFGTPDELFATTRDEAITAARSVGMSSLQIVSDFPIVTATYGYSRSGYRPDDCQLRPFPPAPEHQARTPIYVDTVQADALLMQLDPKRLCAWLERNGYPPNIPGGENRDLAQRAYFVQLLVDAPLRETLRSSRPQARLVFALLHTMAHIALRQASLLCGLDSTSLSEYLLPRGLTFAVYANHRENATIGALTALYEQSATEWISGIREARRCVYDPDCREREGSCHYCTHLAENSCRFFNLNLSRAFLFGGKDRFLGTIGVGYFDPSLDEAAPSLVRPG